jgi:5-oxoprolinase (ATP-hydrolysing) subunit A
MNDSEKPAAIAAPAIDLNADLGEGLPNDRALLGLVTSASICCGAHAGSASVIRRTLFDARDLGVVVGAHPGYPDREGFGRLDQALSSEQVEALIADQLSVLGDLAREAEVSIRYLKPHGALYNQAQRQEPIARGVVAAAAALNLPLLGQPGALVETLCAERGVRYITEGFPDRRYRDDGSLWPRSEPGAILVEPEEIAQQVLRLVVGGRVATLCIHGDDPRAVANAELVRAVLSSRGIAARSFMEATR